MKRFVDFSSDDQELTLEYLYTIGLGHAKRGKPMDAIFYFDKVLLVDPNHVNALINKGNALGKLGKYADAISVYNAALKIKPNHPICLLNKGLALHYLRRHDEAIDCYDKILSQEPDNADALYQKACTKSLQNKVEESLSILEHAVKLDSQFAAKASGDKDFDPLRNDARFKALTS
jgi:tetratricopeptide (TPR) repeat protein